MSMFVRAMVRRNAPWHMTTTATSTSLQKDTLYYDSHVCPTNMLKSNPATVKKFCTN